MGYLSETFAESSKESKSKFVFIWNLIINFCFWKIRKGIEISPNYEPEFDKLAQELARTVTGDSINDILTTPMTANDD